jgi:hypothetical protein
MFLVIFARTRTVKVAGAQPSYGFRRRHDEAMHKAIGEDQVLAKICGGGY